MKKIGLVFLTGVFALGLTACGGQKMKMPKFEMPEVHLEERPEIRVQKRIARILAAEDEVEYLKEVADLVQLGRDVKWDHGKLLDTVIDYAAVLEDKPETVGRYSRLLATLNIPRSAIVGAAAGRLDGEGRPAAVSRQLLRMAAPPDPKGRVDFSHFRQYLEAHRTQPPKSLVLWMYQLDPASAMWEILAIQGQPADRDAVATSEHAISEVLWRSERNLLPNDKLLTAAADQLDALSQSKAWPVRLYVAETLAQQPKLRKPALVERLKRDESDLVKAAMGM